MKVVTVVGARPQFIKAAAFSRVVAQLRREGRDIEELLVHTGQHYDRDMSEVFFEELEIPRARYNLEIGSGPHGMQTGRMLEAIEKVLMDERPDVVLVYGDTNSTLAGAIAAAKLHIPVAHVEAGLRSFNRRMPEEVNRVIADHIASLLFCPTEQSVENLRREGVEAGVHQVGDIMYDSMIHYRARVERSPRALPALGLTPKGFVLATVHRAENTDDAGNLRQIFAAFSRIEERYPVVVALHPRTRKLLAAHGIAVSPGIRLLAPLPYLEMIELEAQARMILTDSGGVQKEAFFVGTPCVTLREETEWVETVAAGANAVCGASTSRIVEAVDRFEAAGPDVRRFEGSPYGKGDAASTIARLLLASASALEPRPATVPST